MAKFTPEDKTYLYQVFADSDHEVREGQTTKKKDKIRWYVYLKREAITYHLDNRFFGEWSMDYHSPRNLDGYSEVYCRITIRDLHRENNGSNSGNGENNGKAAATDAFKRAASSWGIGLYQQNVPQIWTAYDYVENGRTDYKKRAIREKEAMQKILQWLKTLTNSNNVPPQQEVVESVDEAIWKNEIMGNTRDLFIDANGFYNLFHQTNSLKKALQNGTIKTSQNPILASVMMLMHRVETDYGYDAEDVQRIIGSADKPKTVSAYLQQGKSVGDVWKAIQAEYQTQKELA